MRMASAGFLLLGWGNAPGVNNKYFVAHLDGGSGTMPNSLRAYFFNFLIPRLNLHEGGFWFLYLAIWKPKFSFWGGEWGRTLIRGGNPSAPTLCICNLGLL